MLEKRPESNPGQFKLERNRAGETWFVDPGMVRGTLIEGSVLAQSIPDGIARAIYYSFLMQRWTDSFNYADVKALIGAVKRTHALERSRVHFRLTMPDGSPLASE